MDVQQQYKERSFKETDYHTPVQENLPNAKTILVLGVLSIVFSCWYFSIAGVILAILALVFSGRDLSLYYSDRAKYSLSSYNNLKAGRVCAFIGLAVGILFIILIFLILVGIFATWPFWGMID